MATVGVVLGDNLTSRNLTASMAAPAVWWNGSHDVKHYLEGYTEHPQSGNAKSIDQGSGAVLELDEGLTTVHRDEDGGTHSVSAICSHVG